MESWVQTAIIAAGTSLSGAVAVLWRSQVTTQRRTEEKLDDCEEKHETTLATVIELTTQIGDLREKVGRLDGIEQLAKEALSEVARARGQKDERD